MPHRHHQRRLRAIGAGRLLALELRQKPRLLVEFLGESLDLRLQALGRIGGGLRARGGGERGDALLDGGEPIAERAQRVCLLRLKRIGRRRVLLQPSEARLERAQLRLDAAGVRGHRLRLGHAAPR